MQKYNCIWIFIASILYRSGTCYSSVQFYYFSREYPTEKIQITNDNLHLVKFTIPIKMLIHGWMENSEPPYYHQFTQEYLKLGDIQVIQVGWERLASKPYYQSIATIEEAGGIIANFLLKLSTNTTADVFKKIHIISHSLGSHVAGFTGKTILHKSGKLLARITGLDPAGPIFNIASGYSLSSADASFVDITHTDAKVFGLDRTIGHVDFYVNGGYPPQPGCRLFTALLNTLIGGAHNMSLHDIILCSHTSSYRYFAESINNHSIIAFKCKDYETFKRGVCDSNEQIVYGETTPNDSRGKYYFNTQ